MKRFGRISLLAVLIALYVIPQGTPARCAEFGISWETGRVVRTFPHGARPLVGLALSGGGARGVAHIGVIKALEEHGIPIDRIAGTSMGSIVGGLYAAGYGTDALEDILSDIDWNEIFRSTPRRRSVYIGQKDTSEWPLFELRFDGFRAQIPSSLLSGQRVISLLSWLTLRPGYECGGDFDRLPTPFRAVATDLKTGSMLELGAGNLGRAIQASSTIPLLFSPVQWDDHLLVDGGLKNNLPIDTARAIGGEFVIAVAIDESMHEPGELDNPLNIADQATSILMRNVTQLSKNMGDFIINPDLEEFESRNFSDFDALIERGRAAAVAAIPALRDSLESMTGRSGQIAISRVEIVTPGDPEQVRRLLADNRITPERRIRTADIARALERLWDTGQYLAVNASLDERCGHITVKTVPAPRILTVRMRIGSGSERDGERITFRAPQGERAMSFHASKVDSLLKSLRANGLSFAAFEGAHFDEQAGALTLDIHAPRITRIVWDDDLTTRDSAIQREFEFETGDVLDLADVMHTVENLYGTNLFDLVYFDASNHEGGVELRLHVVEKDWTVARFGLRYDDMFGPEGRISMSRDNVFGFGNQFTVTGQTGQRETMLILENNLNRIWKTFYTFNLKAYRHFRRRPIYENHKNIIDYEDERLGTVISAGQQMDRLGNVMAQFKTETIRTRFAPSAGMKNENKEFRSIIFRSQIDSYDRYPFPRNGYLSQIFIESATDLLGGTERYVRLFWNASWYETFWRRHTFGGTVSAATADPSTPALESFTLGGEATRLNCYDFDSGGTHFYADFPGLYDEEYAGTRLAVARIAYRLFIPRAFNLEITYAIGNVWRSKETITTDSLLQGYGIRGSFSTYGGPVGLAWGITSEGDDRLSLSAGWEF